MNSLSVKSIPTLSNVASSFVRPTDVSQTMDSSDLKKSPESSRKILNQTTLASSDSKTTLSKDAPLKSIENIQDALSKRSVEGAVQSHVPPSKKTKYQCDFCRDAIFDSWDEAVQHEATCVARKPASDDSKNDKGEEPPAKAPTKKKRRKSKIPAAKGNLTVNIPFNDGTKENITINGVCTNVLLEEPMTLSEFPSHSRRSIKNFLSGFGKFVW